MKLNGLKGVSAWLVYNKVAFSLIFLRRFNYAHNEQLVLIEELKQCETIEEFKDISSRLNSDKFEKTHFPLPEVIQIFKTSTKLEREAMLYEAITNVTLDDDDCMRLLCCHDDTNGVPYSLHNIRNIQADKIIPMMIETLVECSGINCDFSLMSKEELDAIEGKRIDVKAEANEILSKNADITVSELLSLAVKRAFKGLKL